jgi:hypothetical protein
MNESKKAQPIFQHLNSWYNDRFEWTMQAICFWPVEMFDGIYAPRQITVAWDPANDFCRLCVRHPDGIKFWALTRYRRTGIGDGMTAIVGPIVPIDVIAACSCRSPAPLKLYAAA